MTCVTYGRYNNYFRHNTLFTHSCYNLWLIKLLLGGGKVPKHKAIQVPADMGSRYKKVIAEENCCRSTCYVPYLLPAIPLTEKKSESCKKIWKNHKKNNILLLPMLRQRQDIAVQSKILGAKQRVMFTMKTITSIRYLLQMGI